MASLSDAAKQKALEVYLARNAHLDAIIKPLRTAEYEADFQWNTFTRNVTSMANEYGGLELCPDFQRGHVWSPDQQRLFIENVLKGVITSAGFLIQFNCPNWHNDNYAGDLPKGFQCVDGLQRLTSVERFVAGEIKPFGLSADDLSGSCYNLKNYRFRVAVHCFESRMDLLQHYLHLNAGGTPHSQEELARVKALFEQSSS